MTEKTGRSLNQRVGLRWWTFTLEREGIRVSTRSPLGSSNHLIPYEATQPHLSEISTRHSLWWLAAVGVLAAGAFSLIDERPFPWYGFLITVAMAASLLVWWLLSKRWWKGYHPIMLHPTRPTWSVVDAFLGDLSQRRQALFRDPSTKPTVEATLERLERLRAIGELTQDEHDELVVHALRRANLDSGERPGQYL